MNPMLIGVTGGIGSGTSTVCKILQSLGVVIIDADQIGKEVVENNPEILGQLKSHFDPTIFDHEGKLKRQELGDLIFADPGKKKNLDWLVFPFLKKELDRQVAVALKKSKMVAVDAALIYEWGIEGQFDGILVVTAPIEERIRRIMRRDHLTRQRILDRIGSQLPLEEKVGRADWVIENNGTPEELTAKVTAIVPKILAVPMK
ncbi:dephospho-CoA kinase [candidate division KSB1 bacterium]|nr:dephospho-CoA kinase [candidate division KSB1 bacterium]